MSRLQVVGIGLPHPFKVANVIVHLNMTGMLAPIVVFVPVALVFPGRVRDWLDLVLLLDALLSFRFVVDVADDLRFV